MMCSVAAVSHSSLPHNRSSLRPAWLRLVALLQVRLGQPAKVRPELRGACVDARVERTRAGQRAAKLREGADTLLQQVRQARQQQVEPKRICDIQRRADALWREADGLVADAAAGLLQTAPVSARTAKISKPAACSSCPELRRSLSALRQLLTDASCSPPCVRSW